MDPASVSLYHLTHVENLTTILEKGGLGCHNEMLRLEIPYKSIANPEIQNRRIRTPVLCGPGGVLHDYVPFFFTPLSPMLFRVANNGVEDYREGSGPLLHLRTTVAEVVAEGRPFVFTDGHGTMGATSYYDDLDELGAVDWPVIHGKYWFDSDDYPDRKRRRQAEFLVHMKLPWRLVQEVGVASVTMQRSVEQQIAGRGHKPPVIVRPEWYY